MNEKKVRTCVWEGATYEVLGKSGDTYCLRLLNGGEDDVNAIFVDKDEVTDEKEENIDFVGSEDFGGDIRNDAFFGLAGRFMYKIISNPKALMLVKESSRELSVSDENGILQMRMSYVRNEKKHEHR